MFLPPEKGKGQNCPFPDPRADQRKKKGRWCAVLTGGGGGKGYRLSKAKRRNKEGEIYHRQTLKGGGKKRRGLKEESSKSGEGKLRS